MTRALDPGGPWALAGLFVAGAVAILLLFAANLALDHQEPAALRAGFLLNGVVAVALAVTLAAWVNRARLAPTWMPALAFTLFLLPPAWFVGTWYGKEAGVLAASPGIQWLVPALFYGSGVVVVAGYCLLPDGPGRLTHSVAALYAWGLGVAWSCGAVAVWMLITLPSQAAKAAEENNTPGPTIALVAAVLLVMAWRRHR